jgi:D-alanine transaminase
MFTSVKDIVNAASAKTGIGVITVPDIRWARRDIKSVALLAQVLAKQAAAVAGAGEAWMIEDGLVTEGGSSSAFILTQDDVLVTRQNGSEILPGCTRKAVVKLAEERQLRVEERAFSIEEALAAKEAFITSASAFVQGVVSIDGPRNRDLIWSSSRRGHAALALVLTCGTARKLIASRFQALMVAISMVRLTVSASEKWARTA